MRNVHFAYRKKVGSMRMLGESVADVMDSDSSDVQCLIGHPPCDLALLSTRITTLTRITTPYEFSYKIRELKLSSIGQTIYVTTGAIHWRNPCSSACYLYLTPQTLTDNLHIFIKLLSHWALNHWTFQACGITGLVIFGWMASNLSRIIARF